MSIRFWENLDFCRSDENMDIDKEDDDMDIDNYRCDVEMKDRARLTIQRYHSAFPWGQKKVNWIEAYLEQKRRRVPRERHEYSVTKTALFVDPTCNDGNPPSSSDDTEEVDNKDNVTDDNMDIVVVVEAI
ncbi:hypothetical protein BLNAU_2140 [Blattamonas nauphoetae]|uniref:Uncharacterized protein n=1 Tax=Blattamonas nauphoetae TaxID=2049346 RepID=A0ABQ9YG36_9EUKA|nr:hypothetical protein BLNAU_2140 [Blattamonas nauphoetae]